MEAGVPMYLWSALLSVALILLGWQLRRFFQLIDLLRGEDMLLHKRINDFQHEVYREFVSKDDFREYSRQVLSELGKIEKKLDEWIARENRRG